MNDGTILIVDDESMIRDLLVDMLSDSGDYRLLTAENGRDGLNICLHEEVDLVFTDLRMPIMEGMELLAELRKHKPEIAVVILTAFGRREDVINALRLGASNFLLKPLEVEMVRSIASKILRIRHKERLEQKIFEFMREEIQSYQIPSDMRFTLPLIDIITERIVKVGICDISELMNLRLALDEALVNAIIHGNLEIPSRAKGVTLDELMTFNRLVKERSQIMPYRERKVTIHSQLSRDFVKFQIQDEGAGFDWRSIPSDLEDVEILASHGRGLFLIRAFMTSVEFNNQGNCIIMIKQRNRDDNGR